MPTMKVATSIKDKVDFVMVRGGRGGLVLVRAGILLVVVVMIVVTQLVGWWSVAPSLADNNRLDATTTTTSLTKRHRGAFRRPVVVKTEKILRNTTGVLGPRLEDFDDLATDPIILQRLAQENGPDSRFDDDPETWMRDTIIRPRKPVLDRLDRAGVHLTDERLIQLLPTWEQVTKLYGSEPIIFGAETCEAFRKQVPSHLRFVAVAGQMNTGTNALSQLFRNNLRIVENPSQDGVLWTVPWFKHGWLGLRYHYMYQLPDEHNTVLPVIIIRDPYFWMRRMSQSHCPNLIEDDTLLDEEPTDRTGSIPEDMGVPIQIRWGFWIRKWPSLAHVWSSWYGEYYQQADFPRLIVRFEDLLFHTEYVLNVIRECVGAQWKGDGLVYSTHPAKQGAYYDQYKKVQGGYVSAMVRYGQDLGQRTYNMTQDDKEYAERFLNVSLMKHFQYSMELE